MLPAVYLPVAKWLILISIKRESAFPTPQQYCPPVLPRLLHMCGRGGAWPRKHEQLRVRAPATIRDALCGAEMPCLGRPVGGSLCPCGVMLASLPPTGSVPESPTLHASPFKALSSQPPKFLKALMPLKEENKARKSLEAQPLLGQEVPSAAPVPCSFPSSTHTYVFAQDAPSLPSHASPATPPSP